MTAAQVHTALVGIAFSDSQIRGITLQNGEVTIALQNWQGQTAALHFTGVVYFKAFEFGGDVSEVLVIPDSPEVAEARRRQERDGVTAADTLELTQVSFLGNGPMLTIVVRAFVNNDHYS